MKSNQKCNSEMMRRIMSLSSPSVREHAASKLAAYVPYVVRTNAKGNMQKLFPHVLLNADKNAFNVYYTWLMERAPTIT